MKVVMTHEPILAISEAPADGTGWADSHWVHAATQGAAAEWPDGRRPAFLGVTLCRRSGSWTEVSPTMAWRGWHRPFGEATCQECRAAAHARLPGTYRALRDNTLGSYMVTYTYHDNRQDKLGRRGRVVAVGLMEFAAAAVVVGLGGSQS